jgi:hypothetical protein
MIYMAANYILKNKMWSDQKVNRLIKLITTNASSDRKAAKELFEECKSALTELGARINFDDSGMPSVDAFTKLISASTQSLNQMGIANEKLLKLTQTMQKYQLKEMDLEGKSGPAASDLKGSLFSNLSSLIDKDDNA